MEHLFIFVDGTIKASDDIPPEVLNEHEAGTVTIINTSVCAVLDDRNEWELIEKIPSTPVLKHVVRMGDRGCGKTVANMPKESLGLLSKVLGMDE